MSRATERVGREKPDTEVEGEGSGGGVSGLLELLLRCPTGSLPCRSAREAAKRAREPPGRAFAIRADRRWLWKHLGMATACAVQDTLDSLLTLTAAAERVGVTVPTIRRRIDAGALRAYKLGRRLLINEDELVEDSAKWTRRTAGYAHQSVWMTLLALDQLEEPATAAELAIAIGRHDGNIRKYLKILRIREFVDAVGGDQYEITADGRAFVAENREQYERNENSESARNS